MTGLEAALRFAVGALDQMQRRFAVIGGLAVSARVEPRFTRDVDLATVVADDRDGEQLTFALRARGCEVLALVEQEGVGRLATVRLACPESVAPGIVLDLLFSSSGIEPEIVAAAETIELLPGLHLPVATVGHLIALKLLSESERRPQDRADLVALTGIASAQDLERAREAAALVEARGYARGRELVRAVEGLRPGMPPP